MFADKKMAHDCAPPSPQQQRKMARMRLAQKTEEGEDDYGLWEKPSISCAMTRGRYLLATVIGIVVVLGVMLAVNLYLSSAAYAGVKKAVNKAGTRFIDNMMKNNTFWQEVTGILTQVILTPHSDKGFSTPAPFSSEG